MKNLENYMIDYDLLSHIDSPIHANRPIHNSLDSLLSDLLSSVDNYEGRSKLKTVDEIRFNTLVNKKILVKKVTIS